MVMYGYTDILEYPTQEQQYDMGLSHIKWGDRPQYDVAQFYTVTGNLRFSACFNHGILGYFPYVP